MDLDFPEIVKEIRKIKLSQKGKPLIDSEIAFLQCAWEGISYGKFIRNQDELTRKYAQCYDNRLRSKTEKTLASCGSRLITLLGDYFSVDIDRVSFKGVIEDLVEKEVIKVDARIITDNNNVSLQQRSQPTEFINLNQDTETVIQLIQSKVPIASLYGAPGIGKTTLLTYIAQEYCRDHSLRPIYIDLRYIDSFNQFAFELLSQAHQESKLEEDVLIPKIFEFVESNNAVVILDSILLLPRKICAFIESFALRDVSSNSKVIISSSKKILLNLPDSKVNYYNLHGLNNISDINSYFDHLGLKNEKYWKEMANFYEGNYREIQYAAEFITTFYGGDVGKYWDSGSRVLSDTLVKSFTEIEFSQIDFSIFAMFSKDKNIISPHIVNALRADAGSSKIFARIKYLSSLGLLVQNILPENQVLSYSISPLLKEYLIQEELIEA